jgi:hypothetical protein
VLRVIEEILEGIPGKNKQQPLRLLGHLLSYADYQFGHLIIVREVTLNASTIGGLK